MRMRMLRPLLCLSLAIAILLCFHGAEADKVEVTIDAAYTNPSFVYLISGKELMYVSKTTRREMLHFEIYQPERLTKLDIEAAYSDADPSEQIVNYYGPKYGLRVEHTGKQRVKKIKYGANGQFPSKKAPDAAGRRGDEVFFFRGKKVNAAANFTSWKDAENVKTYTGMPSDIDAAWNDGDGMYLLKGNQLWRWNKDNTVDDAVPFDTVYTLNSWTLKP